MGRKTGDQGYMQVDKANETYKKLLDRENGYMEIRSQSGPYIKVGSANTDIYQEIPLQNQYSWYDLLMTLIGITDRIKPNQSNAGSEKDLQAQQGQFSEIIAEYNTGYNQLAEKNITEGKLANQFNDFSNRLNKLGKNLECNPEYKQEGIHEIRINSYKISNSNESFDIKKTTQTYGDDPSTTYSFDIGAIIDSVKKSNPPQDVNISIPRIDNNGKKVSKDHIIISPEGAVTWIPGDGEHQGIGKSQIAPEVRKELMKYVTQSKSQDPYLTIER